MVDIDKLERDVASAKGELVAVSKGWLRELIAELRIGNAARAGHPAGGAAGGSN